MATATTAATPAKVHCKVRGENLPVSCEPAMAPATPPMANAVPVDHTMVLVPRLRPTRAASALARMTSCEVPTAS